MIALPATKGPLLRFQASPTIGPLTAYAPRRCLPLMGLDRPQFSD